MLVQVLPPSVDLKIRLLCGPANHRPLRSCRRRTRRPVTLVDRDLGVADESVLRELVRGPCVAVISGNVSERAPAADSEVVAGNVHPPEERR